MQNKIMEKDLPIEDDRGAFRGVSILVDVGANGGDAVHCKVKGADLLAQLLHEGQDETA